MIKALDIATQGLLQAERRATDLAREILGTTANAASFSAELDTGEDLNSAAIATGGNTAKPADGFGDLIQQMADLKAAEHSFKANAAVFKRANETLGSLLDAEG